MSTAARDLRAVVFLGVSAFVVLGPFKTQVLLQPGHSTARPWLPMAWQMYHGVGTNLCQGVFYTEKDGERTPLPHDVVQRAVGPTHHVRFTVYRKARTTDVLFVESELPGIVRALCTPESDVRAEARCSAELPGGPWRIVHDGTTNICKDRPRVRAPSEIVPEVTSD